MINIAFDKFDNDFMSSVFEQCVRNIFNAVVSPRLSTYIVLHLGIGALSEFVNQSFLFCFVSKKKFM